MVHEGHAQYAAEEYDSSIATKASAGSNTHAVDFPDFFSIHQLENHYQPKSLETISAFNTTSQSTSYTQGCP